ncbi:TonB-dependent receptor [Povalibacter sp.]|uniref:TonB-dependent receptor n=1 Tax=Povalibacter sp. TaxID=1962978 RepID=UPI002F409396
MSIRSVTLRWAIVAALALSAATTLPASGQETSSGGARNIETIIVTAQKREQNLQDVPISVTAVSEQLLKDTGVKDIKDLTILTPGLLVTSTSNESVTTARIRGIGTVGDNAGLESSVGVVIDGVYRPRNGVGFGDLGELERIEVLKGPQGTLFGKNTSAGVINVVTKNPSFTFGSDIELTAGNFGAMEAAASVTGPLSETIAGRLYAAARERDGFMDVDVGPGPRTQREDGDRSFYTVRGQLLFKPSDSLDIRVVGDYTERDENCCAAPQAVLTPVAGVLAVLNALQPGSVTNPADPFGRLAHSNRGTAQEVTDEGASMEINWDLKALGGATLTSVTGWRDWETINGQDADFTTVDILYRDPNGDFANAFEQLSEELRLAGETERLSWLVGAFYASEDLDSHNQLILGNQFRAYYNALLQGALSSLPANAWPGGLGTRDIYEQDSTSWALFTNNTLRFTDALELTVGLRYTDESKDLDTRYFNEHGGVGCSIIRGIPAFVGNPSAATIFGLGCSTFADPIYNNVATSQSIDESEWSGTAKLAYRFTDEVMAYASYARGYKASGFNLDRERMGSAAIAPTNPAQPFCPEAGVAPNAPACVDINTRFDKELVDSYELGLKTQWADNTILLNIAGFYQDYTDFQLNTFTGVQFVVTSLPKVNSQGVDLDIVWYTPLEQLSIQGGVTYADTQIEDFGAAAGFFRPERENDRLSFAPEWSGSLSATFEQPIGSSLLFRANVGGKFMSEYNTGSNLDPRKNQDGYSLVNARIGLGSASESWMIEAWAQNLTDEEYYQVAFDGTLQGSSAGAVPTSTIDAFLGAPRTYGLTARFKF